jgi:hypothetical protein
MDSNGARNHPSRSPSTGIVVYVFKGITLESQEAHREICNEVFLLCLQLTNSTDLDIRIASSMVYDRKSRREESGCVKSVPEKREDGGRRVGSEGYK